MGSALLSRFDLVFILLDKPDEELDAMLSEHVMALHAGRKRSTGNTSICSTPKVSQPETRQCFRESPFGGLLIALYFTS